MNVTMSKRLCDTCSKPFACRQSLYMHRKKCSGSGNGMATPRFPIVRKKQTSEDLRRVSDRKAELHKIESETDSDNSELTDESSDDEEDDEYLWERFVMSCNRGTGQSIFEWLEGIIKLYKWSEKDELFQKIMEDVEKAKRLDYSLSEAFDFAVHNNKDKIVSSVANCPSDDDFWCALSSRDVQTGCKWLSGDDCNCDECHGSSLIKKVRTFVQIFYGMQNDDVMQDILVEVNERGGDKTVDDAIEESMQRHKEEILKKYDQACNFIETCNIIDDPNRLKFRSESDEENVD